MEGLTTSARTLLPQQVQKLGLGLIHDKPNTRASWAPHGIPGFYLGPALHHYRCYNVWAIPTNLPRVTDTVAWFLDPLQLPLPTPHDLLLAAIYDLQRALSYVAKAHPHLLHTFQPHDLPSITQQLHETAAMYDTTTPPASATNDSSPPQDAPKQRVVSPTNLPTRHLQLDDTLMQTVHDTLIPNLGQQQRVLIADDTPTLSPIPLPPHDPLPDNVLITPAVSRPPTVPKAPESRITRQHTARQRATAYTALNLAQDGSPLTYSKAKAGPDAALWLQAETEEFDRLFHSKTMQPIYAHEQPASRRRDTTYFNPQTKQKINSAGITTYRIRGTAGGDRINYDGPTSAQTAAMPVVKLLLHSVVSEHKKWMTIDIKDYYLGTPLLRPEYIRIPLRLIPSNTQVAHNLHQYVNHESILFQVNKGMYGLPQAGLLAQQRLIDHLKHHGYHETSTPCFFRHDTNGTDFTLVVDDFGIKYSSPEGAQHLITTLQLLYVITVNWTGSTYIGFTIAFDDTAHTVALTMPGYIDKVLQRFAPHIKNGASTPAIYTPPSYGPLDHTVTNDLSSPLSPTAVKILQEQVGCLLYYARGVDATILPAVNHIASLQSNPTESVSAAMHRLLRYCSQFPNNALVFTACDMRLFIQSDASYLSRPKARSVAGGVFYLGNTNQPTSINGPCLALSTIIPVVVSSVAEAEYAAVFMNAKEGAAIRIILDNIGYPQPTTEILCDNMCAVGLASDTLTQKRTKSIHMQFHWIRDRVQQKQFLVTWRKGAHNLADFFTKPLPVRVHKSLMSFLVRIPKAPHTSHQNKNTNRSHV